MRRVVSTEALARLDAVRAEHRALDAEIAAATAMGGADALQLPRMKRRKLRLKDEIASIENALVPDITA